MPTYVFESPDGQQIEREFRMSDCPSEIKLRDVVYRKVIAPVCFVIPPYMKAPGSNGSSYDSGERQAAYLKSEKHKENRAQAERIAERAYQIEERGRSYVEKKLRDPEYVKQTKAELAAKQ